MADFDFENALLPKLHPLQASHEASEAEAQYKKLFLDIWDKYAAKQAFDLNVSGMAHLGSFEQVQRMVTEDGLALLPGASSEQRTRYLYRAWNARNHRGRGLHFLNVYLQMLCPGFANVEQLWLEIGNKYPQDCVTLTSEMDDFMPVIREGNHLLLDGSWMLDTPVTVKVSTDKEYWSHNTDGFMLTSRLRILFDFSIDASGVGNLMQIVRNILPARFVPDFRYGIIVEAKNQVSAHHSISAEIAPRFCMSRPDLLMVTDDPLVCWELGEDAFQLNAPSLSEGHAIALTDF